MSSPYLICLDGFKGWRVSIKLKNGVSYTGLLEWASDSCICISKTRSRVFQFFSDKEEHIIDQSFITYGKIFFYKSDGKELYYLFLDR